METLLIRRQDATVSFRLERIRPTTQQRRSGAEHRCASAAQSRVAGSRDGRRWQGRGRSRHQWSADCQRPPAGSASANSYRLLVCPRRSRVSRNDVTGVTVNIVSERSDGRWLLLWVRLPAEPSRHRVAVWRELRRTGAVSLGQCSWAVPDVTAFTEGIVTVR